MSRTYQQFVFSIQSVLRGGDPVTLPTETIVKISMERLTKSIDELCREGPRLHSSRNPDGPFKEHHSCYLVGNASVQTKIREALGDRYFTTITSEGNPNTDIVDKFAKLYGHAPEKQTITHQ